MAPFFVSIATAPEVSETPCVGPDPQPSRKVLSIGCNANESADGTRSDYPGVLNGRLDEIAIFNHTLSAEQVRQLYVGHHNDAPAS